MKFFNIRKLSNQKAFSLLEVIIAVFVVTIGIIGAVNLANNSISAVALSKSQLIATNLAQEGLEIVRNMRDSNWLKDIDWNTGLDSCSNGCRVQYDNLGLLLLSDNPILKINPNDFYQYDSGTDSHFHRKISINNISDDQLKIVSEVVWNEHGRSHTVSAETRLYNWK